MRQRKKTAIIALFVLLTALSLPKPAVALDLIVTHNPDPDDTTQFSTIQAALDFVTGQTGTTTPFKIVIEASDDPYIAPTSGLITNVPIEGRETARVIITGNGSGAILTADNVNVTIKNLTFINATAGIAVTGNSTVTIKNNVFDLGTSSTGVSILGSAGSSVVNNTFYQNQTAVSRDNDSVPVTNNIFYNSANTIQISQSGTVGQTTINFNIFFPGLNGPTGQQAIPDINDPDLDDPEPLFVDPDIRDFHVQEGSSAIDHGDTSISDRIDLTRSDIGAYGGSDADTIPFMVSGVTVTLSGTDSALVTWNTNSSYVVTNSDPAKRGGYNVNFNLNKSGPPYDNVVTAPSTSTSAAVTGLTTAPAQPAAPIVSEPDFADGTLILNWSAVSEATSYIVYYRDTDVVSAPTNTVEVNSTSHTLTGLINGHNYEITVTALAQSAYHFSVTAFDFTVSAAEGGDPGVSHESNYSPEAILFIGEIQESGSSNMVFGMPDIIIANPNLPNKGCFIATAAYGYYSAPQVQVLRDFRDRYLLTNRPGKAFVDWYYSYGPIGAAFITAHPWLKPVVRVALMPLITLAFAMLHTSLSAKIGVMLFIAFMSYLVIYRRKMHTGGGLR